VNDRKGDLSGPWLETFDWLLTARRGCTVWWIARHKAAVDSWVRMTPIEQADRKLVDPLWVLCRPSRRNSVRPHLVDCRCPLHSSICLQAVVATV